MARPGSVDACPDEPFLIGHGDATINVQYSYPFLGVLDEVRVSSVARSAGWLRTQVDNQVAPAAFVVVGPEQ